MCARRWPTDARRRLGSRKATTVLPEVPESTTPEGADKPSPAHDEWPLDEALDETFPASDPIAPATHIRSTVGLLVAHSLIRSFAHSSGEAAITAWQPSRMQGQPLIPTMAAHMCPHCRGPSSRLRPLRASSASPRRATA